MKIGQLAERTGVRASTLRFYEQKGLLMPASRTAGGYRQYDTQSESQIRLIQFAQSLGFQLDELASLLENKKDWDQDSLLSRLDEKITNADLLIQQLSAKREQLLHIRQQLAETWSRGDCLSHEELQSLVHIFEKGTST